MSCVRGWILVATCGAALLCVGCAQPSDVGQVAGQVTLNGEPVTLGSVLFENAEQGISVNAPLDKQGRFEARTHELAGLPTGTYRVAVSPRSFSDGATPLIVDPSTVEPPASSIPEKYHLPETSGLTTVIAPGKNPPLNLELSAPPAGS